MLEDWDGDGVSNIIEFYGLDLTRVYQGLPIPGVPLTSTDPTKADSDGDLMTDYFELFVWLGPSCSQFFVLWSSIVTEMDFSDIQEEIYHTSPFAIDTVRTWTALLTTKKAWRGVSNGTDTVRVSLTFGDPRLSHSERYTMVFGPIEHAADQFGNLEYRRVRSTCWYIRSRNRPHRDSKFEKPDYDYYAAIRIRWRYTRVQLNDRRFRMASLDIIAKVEMTTPRARRLWLSLIKSEPLACCDAIKTCQTLQSIQCRISSGKGKELDARKSFTFFF